MLTKKMINQRGFTLIEIIAVLLILGILAAVAVPKYFALQADAKNKAALAAVAEGKARVNQYGAQQLLSIGTWPAHTVYSNGNLGTNAGDFSLAFVSDASSVSITATGIADAVSGASASGTMATPGSIL